MKKCCIAFLACLLLTLPVQASAIPRELERALPEGAEAWMGEDVSPQGFSGAVASMVEKMAQAGKDILYSRLRGAAMVLLVSVLCGAVGSLAGENRFLPLAGCLAVTVLAAGSLEELIGLGARTIGELNHFASVLLPLLAAASAVAGSAVTASMQQVTAVFLVGLATSFINGLLLPLTYLYIGVLAAGHSLQEPRLTAIAEGVKKAVTWTLTTALLLFTIYLSVSRVLSGAADAAAVKVTKAAISGAVPVVGGIISDAAESILAGAGVVKGTIGAFGILAVLGACAVPFLHLGIQYLLYKAAAFLSAAMGVPWLSKLIEGLGGAFGLVLGMTGSCAMLVMVAVLCFLGAVSV